MHAEPDISPEKENQTASRHPVPESEAIDSESSSTASGEHGNHPGDDGAAGDNASSPEQELAKWREISLRTAAEMDNLRKRSAREREEAVRYANARLLEELLPVIDNFEMGMQAAAEDAQSMIYIGMEMVRKQLNEFLISQGVEEVATDGLFDPNLHDAVAQESCDQGEDGRILKVTRRGFKLRDRLLRPASVVVSKLPDSGTPEDKQPQES